MSGSNEDESAGETAATLIALIPEAARAEAEMLIRNRGLFPSVAPSHALARAACELVLEPNWVERRTRFLPEHYRVRVFRRAAAFAHVAVERAALDRDENALRALGPVELDEELRRLARKEVDAALARLEAAMAGEAGA
jgi:hypothetical protein